MAKTLGILVFTAVTWFFYLSSLSAEDRQKTLVFAADHFPPYEFATPDGKALGFDSEVILTAMKRLGVPARVEFYPWRRVVLSVQEGTMDGMFSCGYKEERNEYVVYSNPISYTTYGIAFRKPMKLNVVGLGDLKNYSVGAIAGYAMNDKLVDAGIEFTEIPHLSSALPMLHSGRFDILFLTLETARHIAKETGLFDEIDFQALNDLPHRPYYVCFSKAVENVEELVDRFNMELQAMKKDGTYGDIHERY